MPDLMPHEKRRFEAWLKEKGIDKTCPSCREPQLVPYEILAVPRFQGLGDVGFAPKVPMVTRICNNCGQIVMYSAKITGLVPHAE